MLTFLIISKFGQPLNQILRKIKFQRSPPPAEATDAPEEVHTDAATSALSEEIVNEQNRFKRLLALHEQMINEQNQNRFYFNVCDDDVAVHCVDATWNVVCSDDSEIDESNDEIVDTASNDTDDSQIATTNDMFFGEYAM